MTALLANTIDVLIVMLVSLATFAALAAAVLGRWHDVNHHMNTHAHTYPHSYERERTAQSAHAQQTTS